MIYYYSQNYYQASNGIKIGFLLVKLLNEAGFPAKVLCYEPRRRDAKIPPEFSRTIQYLPEEPLRLEDEDIVVYPEIVRDNPLNARRVVRYLLNRPYYLSGEGIQYQKSDYLTAYSTIIDRDLPQLFIMIDDRTVFQTFEGSTKKNKVSFYFGKVDTEKIKVMLPVAQKARGLFKEADFITRLYPFKRKDIFRKLAESELLVSFDPITNINYEATLLGTPVLLLDDSFGVSDGVFNIPLYGFFTNLECLDKARKAAGSAWDQYVEHVEMQKDLVRDWAQTMLEHFRKFEAPDDQNYRDNCSAAAAARPKLDIERYQESRRSRPLMNVNYPSGIPLEVRDSLGFTGAIGKIEKKDFLVKTVKKGLKFLGVFDIIKKAYKALLTGQRR